MKSTFLLSVSLSSLFLIPAASGAVILAGFTQFLDGSAGAPYIDATPNVQTVGITSNVQFAIGDRASGGSNDATFGNSTFTAAGTDDGYARSVTAEPIIFSVTNGTGSTYLLETLLYDAVYTSGTANLGNFSISYKIGSGSTVPVASGVQGAQTAANETAVNYADFGNSLGNILLLNGETIVFTFQANTGHSFRLDNLALAGDIVPEASTAVFLLAGACAGIFRRRRISASAGWK